MRFYSKEWCETVKEKTHTDEFYLKKTKGFTSKYIFIVTDDPDGNDIKVKWEFKEGKVVDYEYTAKPAPSDMRIGKEHWDETISMAKTESSYATWAKVRRGEMTVLGAMGAKLYKVEGDLVKGMAMMAYNIAFADVQNTIPVEF